MGRRLELLVHRHRRWDRSQIRMATDESRRFRMQTRRPDLKGAFTVHNDRFDEVDLTVSLDPSDPRYERTQTVEGVAWPLSFFSMALQ